MSLFALLLAAAAPDEQSLTGNWVVERAISSCAVSRPFGDPTGRSRLGFRTSPNTDSLELFIGHPSPSGRTAFGTGKIGFSNRMESERADYSSVIAEGQRVTTIKMTRAVFEKLAISEDISVKAGRWVDVSVRLAEFDEVLKGLSDCESDLLASWGFDKAEQASIAVQLKGTIAGLIRGNDYPPDLLARGIQGKVGFRMRIDADGRVGECTVLESSGNALLDQHTCELITQRARFSPAVGRDGRSMRSFTYGSINWTAS